MAYVRLSLIMGGRYAAKDFHPREPLCPAFLSHPYRDYYYDHQPGTLMDLPGFLVFIFFVKPFLRLNN
jgi:hypothetical protein